MAPQGCVMQAGKTATGPCGNPGCICEQTKGRCDCQGEAIASGEQGGMGATILGSSSGGDKTAGFTAPMASTDTGMEQRAAAKEQEGVTKR